MIDIRTVCPGDKLLIKYDANTSAEDWGSIPSHYLGLVVTVADICSRNDGREYIRIVEDD